MKGNKLYITLLGFVLLLLSGACEDDFPSDKQDGQGFVLSLSLATQAATRATEPGIDAFNENRIARADVYFFPANATGQDDERCLYVQTGLVPSPISSSATDYELQVPLDPEVISEGMSYYVYVVANPDAGGMTAGTVGEQKIYTITGPNGNSIILPMAGTMWQTAEEFVNMRGFYWSSDLDDAGDMWAEGLFINPQSYSLGNQFTRASGRTIRPVHD